MNALYALGVLHKEPLLVKAAFTLRLLALAGFEPLADGCAVCGRPEPEKPMLDVVHGIVHCAACKQPGRPVAAADAGSARGAAAYPVLSG